MDSLQKLHATMPTRDMWGKDPQGTKFKLVIYLFIYLFNFNIFQIFQYFHYFLNFF